MCLSVQLCFSYSWRNFSYIEIGKKLGDSVNATGSINILKNQKNLIKINYEIFSNEINTKLSNKLN